MLQSSAQNRSFKLDLRRVLHGSSDNKADYPATPKLNNSPHSPSGSGSTSDDSHSGEDDYDSEDKQARESSLCCGTKRPDSEEGSTATSPQVRTPVPTRKARLIGGLVSCNDFFTPRPNLACCTSVQVIQSPTPRRASDNGASVQRAMSRGSEDVEPHPDSLRGRYAIKPEQRPRSALSSEKTRFGTPRVQTPKQTTERNGRIKETSTNLSTDLQQRIDTDRRVCKTGRPGSARELELQLLEFGLTPVYQPQSWDAHAPLKAITSSDITDVRSFIARAAPEGCATILCQIRRCFKLDWMKPRFKLYLQDGNKMHFLLSARKRKKSMSSNYIFSLDENDISRRTGNYFGKLRSNFLGTEFWFYDKGARPKLGVTEARINRRVELGAVAYQNNPLGLHGPRKMRAIIPALDCDGKPYVHEPGPSGAHTLLTKYKCGQDLHKMVVLRNKKPVWNDKKVSYALNFRGRVTRPSVKNFQLIKPEDPENIILQFGKVGKDAYSLDYKYPISALQAFAVALTSVDNKLACD